MTEPFNNRPSGRHTASLKVPRSIQLESASHFRMRQHCRRLASMLKDFCRLPNLPPPHKSLAMQQEQAIKDVLRHHPLNADLVRLIRQTEQETLSKLGIHQEPYTPRRHRSSDGIFRVLKTFGQRLKYSFFFRFK